MTASLDYRTRLRAVLMVVFGAGASFDSVSPYTIPSDSDTVRKYKPPLARQLFEARDTFVEYIDRNPLCRALVGHLRGTADSRTVEERLAEFEAEADTYALRTRHLAATRFYLRDLIEAITQQWNQAAHGVTNYVRLVDIIERKRAAIVGNVAYVTFNYDTMLEDAIYSVTGRRFTSIDDYAIGATPVFKVHGSTDWGFPILNESVLEMPNGRISARAALDRISEMVTGAIQMASFSPMPFSQIPEYLPAVALPVLNKGAESFTLPPEHVSALRDCARRVNTLLLIGWAAADGHFLDLLEQAGCKPTHTLIVAGGEREANLVVAELTRVQNQNLHATEWGFSNLLEAGRETLDAFVSLGL